MDLFQPSSPIAAVIEAQDHPLKIQIVQASWEYEKCWSGECHVVAEGSQPY